METREMHTPEWTFEADEASCGMMFSVYDDFGARITEPYVPERTARLISAAPELLEVLKAAPVDADYADAEAFRVAVNEWLDGPVNVAIAKAELP